MMQLRVIEQLETVPAGEWNRLVEGCDNPFLRHEFLAGLEQHGCVGERWGWLPRHLTLWREGHLVGALPLYLKFNSYGELVFDWAWADAYARAGLGYYPKLVSAIPYTPVTGPRVLVAEAEPEREAIAHQLTTTALELAKELGVSSLHFLFTPEWQARQLADGAFMLRSDCQFHWHNRGYRDFEDYLDRFSAHKRKKLKRERRKVAENGVELEILDGHQASAEHWSAFYGFYASTYARLGGYATLTDTFFRHLGRSLPESVVLVLARHQGRYVAGALSLCSKNTLYGRHWGCLEQFDSLHFEACYYAGIDYCIDKGLAHFEPGAQGEHKVSRGFEPTPTWSAHWLAHLGLARAVDAHLQWERDAMAERCRELAAHLPFKRPEPTP